MLTIFLYKYIINKFIKISYKIVFYKYTPAIFSKNLSYKKKYIFSKNDKNMPIPRKNPDRHYEIKLCLYYFIIYFFAI